MNKFIDCTIRVMDLHEREALKQEGHRMQNECGNVKKIIGCGLVFIAWWHRYMEIHGYIDPVEYHEWLKQSNGLSY